MELDRDVPVGQARRRQLPSVDAAPRPSTPQSHGAERERPILLGGVVDDITVDIGPISLHDAKAVQVALAYCIASEWNESEFYAALVAVKAQLNVRIAKAEKTAQWAEPA